MLEVLKEEYRKANKNHNCDYCGGIIDKGELYKVSTLKYDDLYRWKSHRVCEFLAGEFYKSGFFEDYGNGMVQEDFEECINEVCEAFVGTEYNITNEFTDRVNHVYNLLCDNKLEEFKTKSYGTAYRVVKRKYPIILDYIQGAHDYE